MPRVFTVVPFVVAYHHVWSVELSPATLAPFLPASGVVDSGVSRLTAFGALVYMHQGSVGTVVGILNAGDYFSSEESRDLKVDRMRQVSRSALVLRFFLITSLGGGVDG